jgi:integrase
VAENNPTIPEVPSQPLPITRPFPAQASFQIGQMCFPLAAEAWLATRTDRISGKTFHEYELNIRTLSKFFGQTKLDEITADQIWDYQAMRREQCGPPSINHECSVLQQMLKRVGRWADIAPRYEALPLSKKQRGRALAPEEKERLFRVSAANPNWEAAFLFAMISVNTSTGPKETATLRLKDIDIERRVLKVQPEGAKNEHRVRPIPLNDEAFKAAKLAIARAKRLGSVNPDHYIFPFRLRRSLFDPNRHQTTFKGAWLRMVAAADLPGFRMYDLRHHAITALLENPHVSEETVEAIAGHISREIKKHYSHVRMDARRKAVSGLDGSTPDLSSDAEEGTPLRNQDVVEMLAGLSPRIVAEQIKHSPGNFDTSPEALKKLQAEGVPELVILAMFHAKRKRSA